MHAPLHLFDVLARLLSEQSMVSGQQNVLQWDWRMALHQPRCLRLYEIGNRFCGDNLGIRKQLLGYQKKPEPLPVGNRSQVSRFKPDRVTEVALAAQEPQDDVQLVFVQQAYHILQQQCPRSVLLLQQSN